MFQGAGCQEKSHIFPLGEGSTPQPNPTLWAPRCFWLQKRLAFADIYFDTATIHASSTSSGSTGTPRIRNKRIENIKQAHRVLDEGDLEDIGCWIRKQAKKDCEFVLRIQVLGVASKRMIHPKKNAW